jgi:hypothetical protein
MEAEAKAFSEKMKREEEELNLRERKLTEKITASKQTALDQKQVAALDASLKSNNQQKKQVEEELKKAEDAQRHK